jgi:hypothetical protein
MTGTFPSDEQSDLTATAPSAPGAPTWSGATTVRSMDAVLGVAEVQASSTTNATSGAVQRHFARMFCTRPLSGAQTVAAGGGNTAGFFGAWQESNTNVNLGTAHFRVYVWRPGTGAKVGDVITTSGGVSPGAEPSANTETNIGALNTILCSAVSASDGDVVIVELWMSFTQGMATNYTVSYFYDGATENVVSQSTVSDFAAFIELPGSLTFTTPPVQRRPYFITNQALIRAAYM